MIFARRGGHVTRLAVPLCALVAGCAAFAAQPLNEDQAKELAVAFIRGEIYSDASIEIAKHLREAHLIKAEHNDCGMIKAPAWAFRYQSTLQDQPIDGWLYLDAVTGVVECSSVPFLRVGG